MAERKFDLGDYVEVKDRIRIFYELYAQGRLVTTDVRLSNEPDGVPRVLVEAAAYRTPDDPLPGRGWSWMVLPGSTTYTRGSELENTETSAWGRAIASLGILVDKSIASAQEVANKEGNGREPKPTTTHRDGLLGIAEVGKARDSDFELRQAPDGFTLGFKLKGSDGGFKVLTHDELALQLADLKEQVVGTRLTVWGTISTVTPGPTDKWRAFQVIDAEKVAAAGKILPGVPLVGVRGGDDDPDQYTPIPVAEGQESFDLEASMAIDAEEAATR